MHTTHSNAAQFDRDSRRHTPKSTGLENLPPPLMQVLVPIKFQIQCIVLLKPTTTQTWVTWSRSCTHLSSQIQTIQSSIASLGSTRSLGKIMKFIARSAWAYHILEGFNARQWKVSRLAARYMDLGIIPTRLSITVINQRESILSWSDRETSFRQAPLWSCTLDSRTRQLTSRPTTTLNGASRRCSSTSNLTY